MTTDVPKKLVPFTFKPTGRTQHWCTGCSCTVDPTHIPGSEDCDRAALERLRSINDD